MLVASILKRVLWMLRYPSFPTELVGPHPVGAIKTRMPGSVGCQIQYPVAPEAAVDEARSSSEFHPYFRREAVHGVAEYGRIDPALLEFLSNRRHPCAIGADPRLESDDHGEDDAAGGYPIVVFSHGLGGCMEMYTQLCTQIASQGFWVVALEHEDGSAAYAEGADGEPIMYERPDGTPYSREKVTTFRRAFLRQRVEETASALKYILSSSSHDGGNETDRRLQKVMKAADRSKGFHLLGHSFGGASMLMTLREHVLNKNDEDDSSSPAHLDISSLCVLDPWAFSLEDQVLKDGVPGALPTLSILSESWLSNPETSQVRELLANSVRERVTSLYAPNSVHASFADSVSWLPGFVLKRMRMRGAKEKRHETIRNVAVAFARHIRDRTEGNGSGTERFSPLRPYHFAQVNDELPKPSSEPHEEPIDAL